MISKSLRVGYGRFFLISFFVMLISRILDTTDNYNFFLDPVIIVAVYVFFIFYILLRKDNGKIKIRKGLYIYPLVILFMFTILWGLVFVDNRFYGAIFAMFRSQIMYVVIIIVTIIAIHRFGVEWGFLKYCYFALSLVLLFKFVQNIDEVDLSNLSNIMSANERTRANFGYGHYNTLGAACVCGIILRDALKMRWKTLLSKVFSFFVLLMLLVMLLCCASRSAITSLLGFYLVQMYLNLNDCSLSKRIVVVIKFLIVAVGIVLTLWVVLDIGLSELLVQTQRSYMFTDALPLFFEAKKIWTGLGFASTTVYALGETPYYTYWLDNAYIYYLVTTGVIGFFMIMSAVVVIGVTLYKKRKSYSGRKVFAAFCVYLYVSLFEAFLFNGGSAINCIYIPWFLTAMSNQKETSYDKS